MTIYDCEQGTPEWYQLRLGRVTASEFAAATAGGQGKTRKNYMYRLISERMTGIREEDRFISKYMQWGTETEGRALAVYELEMGIDVSRVGFIAMDEHIGCSPDGMVNDDGLVQVKCPSSRVHVEYMVCDKVPSSCMKQVQGEIMVCERDWSDFWSYDPRNRIRSWFLKRANRDEKIIKELKDGLDKFVSEMLSLDNSLHGDMDALLRKSIDAEQMKRAA